MLDVVFGQTSDAGRVRPHNEDSAGWFEPRSRQESRSRGWLFAVADGVGGRDLGEVASALAVKAVTEGFAQASENTSLSVLLPQLVHQANAAIHDEGLLSERRGQHMATTLVACALRHDQAVIAHVGDSRCYLVRDGKATLLTRDHTWVNEQRKLGLISATEAEQSDKKHVLTRSLGPELFVSAEMTTLTLRAGDVLMLCSDGLHGAMYLGDIARIATQQEKAAEEITKELVSYAIEVDGSDNTTAQVIQVKSVEAMGMYRGRLYPLPTRI